MWILELTNRLGKLQRFHLVFGGDYTIGRKDCDIIINDADVSISRTHAKITVLSVPAGNLGHVDFVPEIYLADHSKHGTFVNEAEVLSIESSRKLHDGDKLRFGKYTNATLYYSPIVVATSDTLGPEQKKAIVNATGKIGGILSAPMEPHVLHEHKVSPFMFVFCTNEVSGEPAALKAMMNGYVLVSAEYIPDLFVVMRDSCRLPLISLPQPGNFDAMRSPLLADRPYHRPEPAIYGHREFLYSQPPTPSAIFRMMNVVFLDQKLFNTYEDILDLGGGKSCQIEPQNVLDWEMTDEDLPLLGLLDVRESHGMNTIFLVGKHEFQTVLEAIVGQGMTLDPALVTDSVKALVKLWDMGFKLMHEENIHVAVYCADTAGQILDNAPGILKKSEMGDIIPQEEELSGDESDATEDGYSPQRGGESELQQQHSLRRSKSRSKSFRRLLSSMSSDDFITETPAGTAKGYISVHEPQQLCSSPVRSPQRSDDGGDNGGSLSPHRQASSRHHQIVSVYEQFKSATKNQREEDLASPERDRTEEANSRGGPRAAAHGVPNSMRDSRDPRATEREVRARMPKKVAVPVVAVSPLRITKTPTKPSYRFGDMSAEEKAVAMCREFTAQTMNATAAKVERECRNSLRQKYMSAPTKQFLEATVIRFRKFLANLEVQEREIGPQGATTPAAVVVIDDVKVRCDTLIGAVHATSNQLAVQLDY